MLKILKNNKKYFVDLFKIHSESFCKEKRMSKHCFFDEFKRSNRLYFVAIENQEIIGYIGVLNIDDDYNIINLAVKPAFRRRKVASMLIEKLKKTAYKNNIKTISLEVSDKNKIAIDFYKKNGFVLTNIRKKYYNNSDAYIMWLYL